MSNRRLRFAAAVALSTWMAAAGASAQTPSLDEVLKRSAAYVAEFRKQLSEIVAEETYRQEIVNPSRIGGGAERARTLRSDLLLVKPSDADRHVELRDVFEGDGKPIRDRQSRLEQLLADPASGEPSTRR